MAKSPRDLLSLLMKHDSPLHGDGASGEQQPRTFTPAPPPRVTDPEVRPSSPRPTLRGRQTLQKLTGALQKSAGGNATNSAPLVSAPRLYVPAGAKEPISLTQIAATPAPSKPRSHSRTLSELAVARLLIYPVLLLVLLLALWFAWGRMFGSNAGGGVNNVNNPNGPGVHNSNNNENRSGAGENGDINKIDGNNYSPGPSQDNTLQNRQNIQNEDAKNPPAHPHILRAIAYPDSGDGVELANTTVSQLRQRGFPDARSLRLAKDAEGKRFEVVVVVGLGETARDPALLSLGERLRAVPGFGPGQSKQRPFEDAFIIRQPEADRGGSLR